MVEECGDISNLLTKIQKCFLSGSNLKFLDWEKTIEHIRSSRDPVEAQESVLQVTVLHPSNLLYPVKEDYQRTFLKKFISQLENCGEEVCESLYKEYLVRLSSGEPQQYHHRHFLINGKTLTIQEHTSIVSGGTTGLATWEGGLALSEWCLHNPSLLRGRHVLELGCGLGLTGLCVSLCCHPQSYTLTDHHPAVLRAVERNLLLNREILSDIVVKTELLDWEDIYNTSLKDVDVVLAADVVFDERLFPALVATFHHLLSKTTSFAVLACTERNPQTLTTFLTLLGQKDLEIEELECPKPETFLYSLSPPIRLFSFRYGGQTRCADDAGSTDGEDRHG